MLCERDQIILRKTLTYSNGYRELEMYDDALAELDTLSEGLALLRESQQMRLAICMEAKRWKQALPSANRLASVESSDPGDLINLAYVTRRADSLAGARIILENAARRYPDEAIIYYNLGCYACCDGELDVAKTYLKKAFALDPSFVKLSKGDDDLKTLQTWLPKENENPEPI